MTHPAAGDRRERPGGRGAARDRGTPRPDAAAGLPASRSAPAARASRRSPTSRDAGTEAIVFGDSDGRVHALDGRPARSCPGSPPSPTAREVTKQHPGIDPGHEPMLTNVGGRRPDGNGRHVDRRHLDAPAAPTSGTRSGKRRPGWPKTLDPGVDKPPIPRPDLPFTRLPIRAPPRRRCSRPGRRRRPRDRPGGLGRAPPRLERRRQPVPGWPVHVTLPAGHQPPTGLRDRSTTRSSTSRRRSPTSTATASPSWCMRTQYSFTSRRRASRPARGVSHRARLQRRRHAGARVPDRGAGARRLLRVGAGVHHRGRQRRPSTADVDGDGKSEIASAAGIFTPDQPLRRRRVASQALYGPFPGGARGPSWANQHAHPRRAQRRPPRRRAGQLHHLGRLRRFGAGGQLIYAEPGSGRPRSRPLAPARGQRQPDQQLHARLRRRSAAPRLPGFPSKAPGPRLPRRPGDRRRLRRRQARGPPGRRLLGPACLHRHRHAGPRLPQVPHRLGGLRPHRRATSTATAATRSWRRRARATCSRGTRRARRPPTTSGGATATTSGTRAPTASTPGRRGVLRACRVDRAADRLTFTAPGDDWYARQGRPLPGRQPAVRGAPRTHRTRRGDRGAGEHAGDHAHGPRCHRVRGRRSRQPGPGAGASAALPLRSPQDLGPSRRQTPELTAPRRPRRQATSEPPERRGRAPRSLPLGIRLAVLACRARLFTKLIGKGKNRQ